MIFQIVFSHESCNKISQIFFRNPYLIWNVSYHQPPHLFCISQSAIRYNRRIIHSGLPWKGIPEFPFITILIASVIVERRSRSLSFPFFSRYRRHWNLNGRHRNFSGSNRLFFFMFLLFVIRFSVISIFLMFLISKLIMAISIVSMMFVFFMIFRSRSISSILIISTFSFFICDPWPSICVVSVHEI